jgi:acetolactate synthase regulatory subunit
MYVITLFATVLLLLALWLLDYFENLLPTTHFRSLSVRCRWEPGAIERVVDWLKKFRFKVLDVKFQRTPDLLDVDVDVTVAFSRKQALYALEGEAQRERDFHLMAIRET